MKNYNAILKETLQKYQYYHQVKLKNLNILQVKSKTNKKQAKFTCYRKNFGKKKKRKIDDLKSLNLSNKTDELNRIQCIFSKNLFWSMIWLMIN